MIGIRYLSIAVLALSSLYSTQILHELSIFFTKTGEEKGLVLGQIILWQSA